jgi:phosphoribosylformylglycinamidine synthase
MNFAVIGRTDDSKVLKVYDNDNLVVDIPAKALSESPTFKRQEKRPSYLGELLSQKTPEPNLGLDEIIYKLIASENICSKEWVYRQYDHEVGVRSVVKCGEGDSGVLRIIGTDKFIAASVGVNSKHCFLDPYEGAKGGLVEECGNVIANGARPMAMVNCCNFGNPEIPESFWYFSKAVEGMNDFCRNMRIPIVGGNVSFYNEDEVKKIAIKATPMIMIVGLIKGEENIITMPFKNAGDDIFLIGETKAELGGSEYHSVIHNLEGGTPPKVEEKKIKATWDFLFELYKRNLVKANHDVNKGGLIITIAEMCFKDKFGADLDFSNSFDENLRDDEFLFSESVGRFIIETEPNDYYTILEISKKFDVEIKKIGVLTDKPDISIKGLRSQSFKLNVEKLKELFDSTIPGLMEI